MSIERTINLFFLIMLSLFVISACGSGGSGGSYTVITPAKGVLYNIISGGTINDNNTITITNDNGEVVIVAYINDEGGISVEKDGEVLGYIDNNTIKDTEGNIILYVDGNGNIVDNNEILSAFSDEFITHFRIGNNVINSENGITIANIEYILTAFINNGVDNVTSVGLARSFGRIVAEEVSVEEECPSITDDTDIDPSSTPLGCALVFVISNNNTAFQSYFDVFLSETGQSDYTTYYNTLTEIISNLANLNSQYSNIDNLANILETTVNTKESDRQNILSQISYPASYVAYTALRLSCALDDNCSGTGNNSEWLNIYTETDSDDDNAGKIKIEYCTGFYYNRAGSSACSGDTYTYIIDQTAINTLDSLATSTGWDISDDNYSTYITLYNNAGNEYKELCEAISAYGTKYAGTEEQECSYDNVTGDDDFTFIEVMNAVATVANITQAVAEAVFTDGDDVITLTKAATKAATVTVNDVIYTNISAAADIVAKYEDITNDNNTTVSTTGTQNIYYFITEFINALDSSYTGDGYSLVNGDYILPDNTLIQGESDFYTALSSKLVIYSDDENKVISIRSLNTSTTYGFTHDTITNILNETKNNVIDVSMTYGGITSR